MNTTFTREQIDDLLVNVLKTPVKRQWKGSKIQFCCTVHGESNPSAGINIDYQPDNSDYPITVFHCFSCGESGTIPWLLYKSLPDAFKSYSEAVRFIEERYNVSVHYTFDPKTRRIKRFDERVEEVEKKRFELPRTKLAVLKSGKETYQYFFSRGFDKNDMREYMIGRDLEEETVTIPVFWEDKKLAGVIGRYVDNNRPHNFRYKVYDNFPKGEILFPLDKLQVRDNTIICCESMFDVMMLRKWGYTNAVATMGGGLSDVQAQMIVDRCKIFIDLFDNDTGGKRARIFSKKRLSDKVLYLTPSYYPNKGKDVCEWGKEETVKVIQSARMTEKIPRL